ncbi:CocE/NonD family hydrolase [Actinomyces sp. 565]|uniref:CocE/NonD family hydrolase n=1 Tax=Actinomyces sp. 565 TaxID=2057794 RepID=UPI0013A69F07|nr:CocE/NonD family hydrolase [Actinomyces sp. 565]NDR53137.1 CocE/NonD family hydrolase [Actinomyces sp. 565]
MTDSPENTRATAIPDSVRTTLKLPAADGPASRAIHEVLEVPMPDGTVLRADVVRPADAAAHPALLTRCPYFGAWRPMVAEVTGADPATPGLMAGVLGMQAGVSLDRAVAAGFAVVAQACRGTDISDGDFRFYFDEAADGTATRAALAALPWCDGRVITFGNSYLTTTQFTAALASTENLAGMTAWVSPSTYDDDLAMRGGVLLEGPSYEWARQQVRTGLWRDGRADAPQEALPEPVDAFTRYLERVGVAQAARDLAAAHRAGGHVVDWVNHPLHDAYWESVAYPTDALADLDVPTLHVSGWYDLFQGGTLRNFTAMASGAAARGRPGDVRLVVGPWTHLTFDGHLAGRDFPGGGIDDVGLGELSLDFWKAVLGDAQAAARLPRDPVRVYIMGADRWIDLPAWPAPDAVEQAWHLGAGGILDAPGEGRIEPAAQSDGVTSTAADAVSPRERSAHEAAPGFTAWVHDPADPVPTAGGQMLMGPPENAGPHDQRDVEARGDVAAFTSAPLTEPVTILGPVRLEAWVAADAVDAHLHAALTDVAPDGTSTLLTDGVLRLSARAGTGRRDPLTPGEPVEAKVDMWATGVHLPAGHRLRLDLAGSNWPRYSVADPADGAPVAMRVLHDADHPSAVVVTTVDLTAHPAAPPHRGR